MGIYLEKITSSWLLCFNFLQADMEGTTFVDAMLPLCNSIRELEEFIEMFGISPEHPDVLVLIF